MRTPIALCPLISFHKVYLPYTLAELRGMCPKIMKPRAISNPNLHTTSFTTPQSKASKQQSRGGLFSWARSRGGTESKLSMPDSSLGFAPVRALPHSILNPPTTLRTLPKKPLPRTAHLRKILYLVLTRVETALLASH
jgi:hypothetical protein